MTRNQEILQRIRTGATEIDTTELDAFVESMGLELESGSVIEKRRWVNVPGLNASELRTYNWAPKKNGTKYDRRVLVQLFYDGSFSVALQTSCLNKAKTLRAMARADN